MNSAIKIVTNGTPGIPVLKIKSSNRDKKLFCGLKKAGVAGPSCPLWLKDNHGFLPRFVSAFLFTVMLLFSSSVSHAAGRYWVGSSGANWNTTGSWSTSSGGASGASVPGSSDTAIFDGGAANNCTIDANVNVYRFRMASGYTATISQNAYTVTVAAGGFIVTAGTFSGSASTITLSGTLTINGGTFTSTSGTLSTTSGITFSSGTFTHNSGTVEMKATATLSGSPTFYNFSIAPAAANTTITVSNTPVINNTFTIGGTKRVTINTGTLDCKGNILSLIHI